MRRISFMLPSVVLIALLASCKGNEKRPTTTFEISFTKETLVNSGPGRVILIFSSDTLIDPDIPNPFQPFACAGMDYDDLTEINKILVTDNKTDKFRISSLDKLNGYYAVRAIIDKNYNSCLLYNNGILYSDKKIIYLDSTLSNTIPMTIKNTLTGFGFNEKPGIELFEVESKMLSEFSGSVVKIESTVVLPDSYESEPDKKYPVVFVLPGWGGTHLAPVLEGSGPFQLKRYGVKGYGKEKIFVFLNQDSRFGYHVFADSENNGPRAKSFIEEFIPQLEYTYRVKTDPESRFLIGQSSGAWASLWLVINYPDHFGMAWAGSPDPVDFRDFIGHNLYAGDANLYYDENGNLFNSLRNDEMVFTIMDWVELETALGEGGQFQSFEAVFGGRDSEGKPEQAFSRSDGSINRPVIDKWMNYDINLVIRNSYGDNPVLLDNKINIVVARNDDFFLDGAVALLDKTLHELGIKSNIVFLEDGGHNTWTDEIRTEMHRKMDKLSD